MSSASIEQYFRVDDDELPTSIKEYEARMARVMKRHLRALTSELMNTYILLLILSVVIVATNMYRAMQCLMLRNFQDMTVQICFCLGTLGYMFSLNYLDQEVIDQNTVLFNVPYTTPWYDLPVPTQKLLLYFMTGNMREIKFDIAKLYNPSVKSFSNVTQMAVSYFMALWSFTT